MKRFRHRLAHLLACLTIVLTATRLSAASEQAGTSDRPPYNVLFIMVDDLRPELGCYGAEQIITPNIDRLAAEGYCFDRAYCQFAICASSRSSVLTGLRPDAIRVYDLHTDFRDAAPDAVTLPQYFKNNGYFTKGIGKIYHWGLDDPASWSVPIDYVGSRLPWPEPHSGAYLTPHGIEVNEAVKAKDPRYAGYRWGLAYEIQDIEDNQHPDGALTVEAENCLARFSRDKDQPFFLAVGYIKPHLPFLAPRKYWDLYPEESIRLNDSPEASSTIPGIALTKSNELRTYAEIPQEGPIPVEQQINLLRGYYACTSLIDAQIGRLVESLKENGLWDNTIICIFGDHGFHLGDKSIWGKHTNFEEAVRAPLIIRIPNGEGGKTIEGLCEFVDIYPTLCELAGMDIPAELDGISLQSAMLNPDEPVKPYAFSQFPRGPHIWGYTMRTDRYRYTVWEDMRDDSRIGIELYDHETDPGESVNRINDPAYADIARELGDEFNQASPQAFPNRKIIN